MKRDYPDRPMVGVGAVIVRDGRVLLVRRATEPLKDEWSVPGGALELGEKLRDGAAREAWEETGLRVEVGEVLEQEKPPRAAT
jgi:ADP-ribose pyrophosphatase